MKELMTKYAKVLLDTCLKIEKGQPLFISANPERKDFVDIICSLAKERGVNDIYLSLINPIEKHNALLNMSIDELKKTPFFDKSIWNEYARRGSAFLMLASEYPGLMKDVDQKKLSELTAYSYTTRKIFDRERDKARISWCIAAVPIEAWAKDIFKDSSNPLEDLWNKIFDICLIKKDNPEQEWDKKINRLEKNADKLNRYQFIKLIYKSKNGTNFSVGLPKNHIWATGYNTLENRKKVLVNFPTEEIFTSPRYNTAEGIVYSSKPLSYNGVIIDDFNITFKEGKVIDYYAKVGEETLKEIISVCDNSDYLGEVSLVSYDSPISNTNMVFGETLFDENAACHLALGDSFPECIENGISKTKDELYELGLNKCDSHIDFMIGTDDLNIIGITEDNKEIEIFNNGNFSKDFN